MDPRLNRLKSNSGAHGGEPKSLALDGKIQSRAASSGPGSGNTTPLQLHITESQSLLAEDAAALEQGLLLLTHKSSDAALFRRKRSFLQEQSKAVRAEYERTQETLGEFPVVAEQVRQKQVKVDHHLEATEKSLREINTAEELAAKDLVRLVFDLAQHKDFKTRTLGTELDNVNQSIEQLKTKQAADANSADAQIAKLATENGELKKQVDSLRDTVHKLQNLQGSEPATTAAEAVGILHTETSKRMLHIEASIRALKDLPANFDRLSKKITLKTENATQAHTATESQLEKIEKELAQKADLHLVQRLESQIATLNGSFKEVEQIRGNLESEPLFSKIEQYVRASQRESSEQIQALKTDVFNQIQHMKEDEPIRELKSSMETRLREIEINKQDLSSLGSRVDKLEATFLMKDEKTVTHQNELKLESAELKQQVTRLIEQLSKMKEDCETTSASGSSKDSGADLHMHVVRLEGLVENPASSENVLTTNASRPKLRNVQSLQTNTTQDPISVPIPQEAAVTDQVLDTIKEALLQRFNELQKKMDQELAGCHEVVVGELQRIDGNLEALERGYQTLVAKVDEGLQGQLQALEKRADLLFVVNKDIEQRVNELTAIKMTSDGNTPILNDGAIPPAVASAKPTRESDEAHLTQQVRDIGTRLTKQENQILVLDKTSATLMSAQMTSEDREALQNVKTLFNRVEKAEHHNQYLRARVDNVTTETLYRQIIGYVAPVLPKFEQGLIKFEAEVGNLNAKILELSNKAGDLAPESDTRVQILEDNLDQFCTKYQQQQDKTAREFRETRDDILKNIENLVSQQEGLAQLKATIDDMLRLKEDFKKIRDYKLDSLRKSVETSSSPRTSADRESGAKTVIKPLSQPTPNKNTPKSKSEKHKPGHPKPNPSRPNQSKPNLRRVPKSVWHLDSDEGESTSSTPDNQNEMDINHEEISDVDGDQLIKQFQAPLGQNPALLNSPSRATSLQTVGHIGSLQKRKRRHGEAASNNPQNDSEDDSSSWPRKRRPGHPA